MWVVQKINPFYRIVLFQNLNRYFVMSLQGIAKTWRIQIFFIKQHRTTFQPMKTMWNEDLGNFELVQANCFKKRFLYTRKILFVNLDQRSSIKLVEFITRNFLLFIIYIASYLLKIAIMEH